MSPLDGKDAIKPVPFDAHEQAQAAAAADYEHQEFPKAVDHVNHHSGVGLQPVLVNSADEEAAITKTKRPKQSNEQQ